MNTFILTALIFGTLQSPVNTEDPLPTNGKVELMTEQKITNPDIKSTLTNLFRDNFIPTTNNKQVEVPLTDDEKLIADIVANIVDYEKLNKQWKESVQKLGPKIAKKYEVYIKEASREFNIPIELITAVIITESLGDPDAVSHRQARGLMQTRSIIDGETGVYGDSFDPETSIRKGTAYLALLKNHYGMKDAKIIIAYNEGPTRTKKINESEVAEHNYFQKISYILENVI